MIKRKLKLKKKEIQHLKDFVKKGRVSAREVKRANVLLLLNKHESPSVIKDILGVSRATVYNIRDRCIEDGVENALHDKPRTGQPRKYTDKHRTEIIAMACTSPPKGRKRWTVRLLAENLKKRKDFKTLNRETVRIVLKKQKPSRG